MADDGVDPACAGMALRWSCAGMRCLVSLDGVFVEFPRSRELWIPAFAGMTDNGVDSRQAGMADDGVDSRLRGNGGRWGGFPPAREWR